INICNEFKLFNQYISERENQFTQKRNEKEAHQQIKAFEKIQVKAIDVYAPPLLWLLFQFYTHPAVESGLFTSNCTAITQLNSENQF
ncbi:MAG: hypothetical protein WCB90_12970, partial [Methanosarcina sp.]